MAAPTVGTFAPTTPQTARVPSSQPSRRRMRRLGRRPPGPGAGAIGLFGAMVLLTYSRPFQVCDRTGELVLGGNLGRFFLRTWLMPRGARRGAARFALLASGAVIVQ